MIQYPLSNSFVNDVLLSFITLINAKTWAYELNSDFKNKSEWTLCHFMNSDLNKQAQALEVIFSRKTKSYHSQTYFNNILRIYLNEKLNFYHHITAREKCSNAYKIRKICFTRLIILLILKYGNHQCNTW